MWNALPSGGALHVRVRSLATGTREEDGRDDS